MIGVAEHDVGAERLDLLRVHRLDRRRRADRHEGGGADDSARGDDLALPRRPVAGENAELEAHARGTLGGWGNRSLAVPPRAGNDHTASRRWAPARAIGAGRP